TYAATADGRTFVRAGAGLFYNVVPLNVAAFDQLQTRLVSTFAEDGTRLSGPTELANVTASPLRRPRSVNWSVDLDREWIDHLFVRIGYQQRESRREPIVDATDAAIVLLTDGRSRYREAQVSGRYVFRGSDQIVASYTRSSATGDLNDFNGFFGNIENPVIQPNESGPLAWDAPNRVLLWASISL